MGISNINNIELSKYYQNLPTNTKSKIKEQLIKMGVPLDVINAGLNAVLTYTSEHGIDTKNFIKKITNLYNNSKINPLNNSPEQELENKLFLAGIPNNIISKGQKAIEQYAKENFITLPPPPPLLNKQI